MSQSRFFASSLVFQVQAFLRAMASGRLPTPWPDRSKASLIFALGIWLLLGAIAQGQTPSRELTVNPADIALASPIRLDAICGKMAPPVVVLAPGNPSPSTRRMAERLAKIYERAAPESMAYLSDRLIPILEQKAIDTTDVNERLKLKFNLALHLVNAARPDDALNTFAEIERFVASSGGWAQEAARVQLRIRKALAFLRLGEQENCLAMHNAESCLFPLRPSAYHLLPRGSQGAISIFKEHLKDYPEDLGARWLLNLAHMTLGEYPGKVDAKFVIPPERFASDAPFPRFVDISEGLGLNANDLAGGCIVDDFDNDGFYDIVISAWDAQGQLRYFRNNRDGTFVDRTSEAGLVGEVGALNIEQTDYNNDGLLDIWMMRGGWLGKAGRIPSSLLKNNGDGTFTDVTEEAGLLRFRPTMACRWFDYDGDGWLDLFVGNESTDPNDPDECELFHNNADGTFTECAQISGIKIARFVKGVASADYDNDGRPDLFLSVRGGTNVLLHNDGPVPQKAPLRPVWRFSDQTVRSKALLEPTMGFGTFFFDYDNDGWQDLLVFGYYLPRGVGDVAADYLGIPHEGAKTKLFRNRRDGTFENVTQAAHLDRVCHTMGHNYGDLDNDGWLDFYCGTGDPDFRTLIPNRMFRNQNGVLFQDVSTATGTGHIQKGHAVAFADLDDDGSQDIYATMGGAYTGDFAQNVLFSNPGSTNRFLKLKLVGTQANRVAIGTRIKVSLENPQGLRELHRVVSSGGSFGGNPLRQEIGLGNATAIKFVEIWWPGSDTHQRLTGFELNRSYQIREGEEKILPLQLHPVTFRRPGTSAARSNRH